MTTHGLSQTPEYRAWQQMIRRCHNPEHPAYANYGGRGISVCDAWRDDVSQFIADVGHRPEGSFEIDRIDNDRGYEPGNVRWTDRATNSRNRRSNRIITVNGESLSVAEWAERVGLHPSTIVKRLDAGWSEVDAVSRPARQKARNGEAKPDTKNCDDCGVAGVYGARCRSCENQRRWQEGVYE